MQSYSLKIILNKTKYYLEHFFSKNNDTNCMTLLEKYIILLNNDTRCVNYQLKIGIDRNNIYRSSNNNLPNTIFIKTWR